MLMRSLPFEVDDEDLLPALGLAVEEAEDDEGEALAIITYDPFDELMNDDEEHVDPETTLQWRNSWECQVVHAFEHSGHEHILRHYYNSINMDLEVPLGQFFFVSCSYLLVFCLFFTDFLLFSDALSR